MSDQDYTDKPTRVRVLRNDEVFTIWQLDGVDDSGNYTEWVGTYDTFFEALAGIPYLLAAHPTIQQAIEADQTLRTIAQDDLEQLLVELRKKND